MSWRHYLRYCSMHTCIQSRVARHLYIRVWRIYMCKIKYGLLLAAGDHLLCYGVRPAKMVVTYSSIHYSSYNKIDRQQQWIGTPKAGVRILLSAGFD